MLALGFFKNTSKSGTLSGMNIIFLWGLLGGGWKTVYYRHDSLDYVNIPGYYENA